MIKWLKSGLCKFGFMLTMLGAGTMNSGCEFMIPEGQLVKCEADGVISEQEEQDLIRIASKEHKIMSIDIKGNDVEVIRPVGVTQFEGPIQMFINDSDIFFNQEFEDRGFDRIGISKDLHIYMPEDEEEFKKKYKMAHANLTDAPFFASAFYSGANNTIYIPKGEYFEEFLPTMHHEIGHSMRISDEEFPALMNEMYSNFKLYLMNKTLGSSVLPNINRYFPRDKLGDFEEGYLHNYQIASLGFLIRANDGVMADNNKMDGNLEATVDYISKVPKLNFEKEVRGVVENYPEMRSAYMDQLEKLLDKPGFRDSFKNLSDKEFKDFTDFLKASNFSFNVFMDHYDELDGRIIKKLPPEDLVKYDNPEILEKAIEYGYKVFNETENPFFKANSVYDLTFLHSFQKIKLINQIEAEWTPDQIKSYLELSLKTIELNKDFPCEFDFYTCPRNVEEPNWNHVESYLNVLNKSQFILDNHIRDLNGHVMNLDALIEIGEDFSQKFYKDDKFRFFDNFNKSSQPSPVAIHGPWINQIIASLYVRRMMQASTLEEYVADCKKAKEFYGYSQLGSCEIMNNEEDINECRDAVKANFYDAAQQEIDKLGTCNEEYL